MEGTQPSQDQSTNVDTEETDMEIDEQDGTMSRREAQDEILVDALASGLSYEAAGELARCSGRTVARR